MKLAVDSFRSGLVVLGVDLQRDQLISFQIGSRRRNRLDRDTNQPSPIRRVTRRSFDCAGRAGRGAGGGALEEFSNRAKERGLGGSDWNGRLTEQGNDIGEDFGHAGVAIGFVLGHHL